MTITHALVTGANGFIGSALTLRLLSEGIAVRAMCRTPANGDSLRERGAEIVQSDLADADRLIALARGCDVIFHVAAVGAGSIAAQRRVNVTGSENVARAALVAGVGRLVHVSTVAVYGMRVRGTITESTPIDPSPRDAYQQSKAAGEQAVRRIANREKLPTVIIRPAMVYGPRSVVWTRGMYNLCRRLHAVPALPGHAHPIYVDDLVDLLITAAQHPAAPYHLFNGAAESIPWADFLGHYARMAGITRTILLSPRLLRSLSPPVWLIEHGLDLAGNRQDLRGALDYLSSTAVYSNERARNMLGWQPRTSLIDGMAACQRWLTGQNR